jgi:hypothetical protein
MDPRLIPTALPPQVSPIGFGRFSNPTIRIQATRNGRPVNTFTVIAELDTRLAAGIAVENELMRQAAVAEIIRRDAAVQQSLANDVQTLEAVNSEIDQIDDRVLPILKTLTGQELGTEPDAWRKWWTDQLGYVYQSNQPATKPTFTDTVTLPDVSVALQVPVVATPRRHTSCFAAGTLVHTLDGPKTIESIQVGDRVLSQDPSAGTLAFQPVVAVHRNEPSATLRIAIDQAEETIVATGIHRFWRAGKGWVMARELKPGDRLRAVGGVAQVQSIETDATQPVYNLDVAQNRDFFVGKTGLLVHDFSFVQPVLAPFDRQPDPAAVPAPAASPVPDGTR